MAAVSRRLGRAAAAAALGAVLALLLLQLAQLAGAAPPADEEQDDPGLLQRLKAYCKTYAVGRGLAQMYSDDDIKCLLMVARAMRKDFSPMVQPAATVYNFVIHTTPRCKVSLIAKGKMFLDPEFLKGLAAVLFGSSTSTTEPAATVGARRRS